MLQTKCDNLEIAQKVLHTCEELHELAAFLIKFSAKFQYIQEMDQIRRQKIESDSLPF
jgi:hypothetical protein